MKASRMTKIISKYLGHWWVCIVFGLIAVLMFTVLVPNGVNEVTANRTLAPRILDEYYPSWTAQNAQTLFASLGASGRRAYQLFYLKLDFWFPVLSLSMFYAGLLSLAVPQSSRWRQVNILPIAMYLFDLAENLNHFSMAGSYPDLPAAQLAVGPILTLLKYALITGLPLLAVAGFAKKRPNSAGV
jgi:hypothetical protein